MKNVINLVFVSLVLLLPFGCTKKYHGDLDEYQNYCSKPDNYKISDLVSFKGEMAYFKNDEDFNLFFLKSLSLSPHEEIELMSAINYNTYESLMDSLYDILTGLETRDEVLQFITDHDNYFALILNEDNEEEIIEINEASGPTSLIYNADNMLQVGTQYYKFVGNMVLIDPNKELLKRINSINEVHSSGINYKEVYEILDEGSGEIMSRSCNDLGVKNVERETYKPNWWCSSHRRVRFTWMLLQRKTPAIGDIEQRIIYAETQTRPYNRGSSCIWHRYRTLVTRNDFHFNGRVEPPSPFPTINFNILEPDITQDTRGLETSDLLYIFTTTTKDKSKIKACWDKERVSVTTRGLNGLWLIVDK